MVDLPVRSAAQRGRGRWQGRLCSFSGHPFQLHSSKSALSIAFLLAFPFHALPLGYSSSVPHQQIRQWPHQAKQTLHVPKA